MNYIVILYVGSKSKCIPWCRNLVTMQERCIEEQLLLMSWQVLLQLNWIFGESFSDVMLIRLISIWYMVLYVLHHCRVWVYIACSTAKVLDSAVFVCAHIHVCEHMCKCVCWQTTKFVGFTVILLCLGLKRRRSVHVCIKCYQSSVLRHISSITRQAWGSRDKRGVQVT